MASLFNIRQDHLSLLALIEQNEGVLSEEELKAFELNQEDFQNKAISYAYIIRKYESESATIKAELDRLGNLKKTSDNAADRFKKLLGDAMTQFGFEKIESDTIKISFRKSKKLDVSDDIKQRINTDISVNSSIVSRPEDDAPIPDDILDYIKVKVDLDAAKLKTAVDKEGVQIEGVSIVENKNLQIR